MYHLSIDLYITRIEENEGKEIIAPPTYIVAWTWNFVAHFQCLHSICGISYRVHTDCMLVAYKETHFFADILVVVAHYTMVLLLQMNISQNVIETEKFANLIVNWNKLSRKPKQTDIITCSQRTQKRCDRYDCVFWQRGHFAIHKKNYAYESEKIQAIDLSRVYLLC